MTSPSGEVETYLKKSGQVTLNATGYGVLTFETENANTRWVIQEVVVSTNQASTATTIPVATIALNTTAAGTMSPGNHRGASWSGNQDTFRGNWDVGPCDFASILFGPAEGEDGTVLSGVIASAILLGKRYLRRS